MAAKYIVIHLSGPDRPGLTHGLLKAVADTGAHLRDFGQSVVHGLLSLSALIELGPDSTFLEAALYYASANGLKLEAQPVSGEDIARAEKTYAPERTLCISLVGDLADARALAACTREISQLGINILEIKTLSRKSLHGVEFIVAYPRALDIKAVKHELYLAVNALGVDVAIQKNDWFRYAKRLVCLDVDSTFVNIEAIDELAGLVGQQAHVAKITEAAMNGKLDFESALRERVKCLKGLKLTDAEKHLATAISNPGIDAFVKKLKRLGFRIGLVSGGFDFFVNALAKKYELDFAFANSLEVDADGAFTGKVLGEILGPEQKAKHLRKMCETFQLQPEHAVAIGDGANDLKMLEAAGLGVAYRAKPFLKNRAHMALDHAAFDDLFYLMGCADT
ncbi:MAG TPA: phosphoserine phosphatase SerB [Bdellovibrionota bacterium]|jgi:phosphoserine phosphatase|nr:phosphoserine phosphatase SerB [Bdellovibrionota bacterium]